MPRNNRATRITGGWVLWSLLFAFVVYCPVYAQSQEAKTRVFSLNVINGKVEGENAVRVTQGERVNLRWTTDSPLDIHLHGYDIEMSLEPGVDVTMRLEAHATGRFPITVHGKPSEEGASDGAASHSHDGGERTLIYLEVYPD